MFKKNNNNSQYYANAGVYCCGSGRHTMAVPMFTEGKSGHCYTESSAQLLQLFQI